MKALIKRATEARKSELANLHYGFNQIVILQFTTLSLLFSLSASAAAVLPAMITQGPAVTAESTTTTTDVHIPRNYQDVKSQDYEPISDPRNVQKFVTDYFSDIPIMARIAACESHNRQFNSSGNVQRGDINHYDVGVMQINELYWDKEAAKLGLDLHTADGNVAFARYLYEEQGVKPWASSQACWGKYADAGVNANS